MRDARCGMRDTGYSMRDTGFEHRVSSIKHQASTINHRVASLRLVLVLFVAARFIVRLDHAHDKSCDYKTVSHHHLQELAQVFSLILSILCLALCGCSHPTEPDLELPTASKGYILYVFAKKTEVMIDFCKSDGISRDTRLDVFRPNVPGMDEPVKIGELTVAKVGDKMSRAKVAAFTSSLQMKRGDRVFPHPILIISDATWIASRKLMDGWKSDTALADDQEWKPCEVLPDNQLGVVPEMRQLAVETGAKPVWHPSVSSKHGDVFFRKVFHIDTKPTAARINLWCGGITNIYINDTWVGETKEWPEISSFKVDALLNRGRNLLAIHVVREPRVKDPPLLLLALNIQTGFR